MNERIVPTPIQSKSPRQTPAAPRWAYSTLQRWVMLTGILLGSGLSGCGGCGDEEQACAGDGCGAQVCDGGMCKSATLQGVPAAARACEAVLELPDGATWTADFGEGVKGTAVAEGPRVAIAFLRESDATFGADAVGVALFAKEGTELTPNVTNSSCFDADGKEIEDVSLSLGQ